MVDNSDDMPELTVNRLVFIVQPTLSWSLLPRILRRSEATREGDQRGGLRRDRGCPEGLRSHGKPRRRASLANADQNQGQRKIRSEAGGPRTLPPMWHSCRSGIQTVLRRSRSETAMRLRLATSSLQSAIHSALGRRSPPALSALWGAQASSS